MFFSMYLFFWLVKKRPLRLNLLGEISWMGTYTRNFFLFFSFPFFFLFSWGRKEFGWLTVDHICTSLPLRVFMLKYGHFILAKPLPNCCYYLSLGKKLNKFSYTKRHSNDTLLHFSKFTPTFATSTISKLRMFLSKFWFQFLCTAGELSVEAVLLSKCWHCVCWISNMTSSPFSVYACINYFVKGDVPMWFWCSYFSYNQTSEWQGELIILSGLVTLYFHFCCVWWCDY